MTDYRVYITPAAERYLKWLPPDVADFVYKDLSSILKNNPLAGEKLEPPFSDIRSYHFAASGVKYRVAYSLEVENRKIVIYYVGPRGEFYKRLRRLF